MINESDLEAWEYYSSNDDVPEGVPELLMSIKELEAFKEDFFLTEEEEELLIGSINNLYRILDKLKVKFEE